MEVGCVFLFLSQRQECFAKYQWLYSHVNCAKMLIEARWVRHFFNHSLFSLLGTKELRLWFNCHDDTDGFFVIEKILSLRCWWSSLISRNSIKCPIFYFTFSWIRESVVSIFHPGSSCHVNDRRQQSKNQFVIPTTDCKGQGVLSKTGQRKKTGIICEHEKCQSFETMLI